MLTLWEIIIILNWVVFMETAAILDLEGSFCTLVSLKWVDYNY